jgi:hypothetical protein
MLIAVCLESAIYDMQYNAPCTPCRRKTRSAQKTTKRDEYSMRQRIAFAVCAVLAAVCAAPKSGAAVDSHEIPESAELPRQVKSRAYKWVQYLTDNNILPGLTPVAAWNKGRHGARAIETWFKNFWERGTVETYKPKARKRQHEIPDDVLHECINRVASGCYRTRKQACELDPYLQEITKTYDVSYIYLWDRMREYDPSLQWCVKKVPKMDLAPHVKAQRVAYSQQMKQNGLMKLLSYVWIDQKKLFISPQDAARFWGKKGDDPDSNMVLKHPLSASKYSGYCVYYYAAVNAMLGVVGIYMTTGTVGPGVGKSEYLVSCRTSST